MSAAIKRVVNAAVALKTPEMNPEVGAFRGPGRLFMQITSCFVSILFFFSSFSFLHGVLLPFVLLMVVPYVVGPILLGLCEL